MVPETPLPLPPGFVDVESYVESLLDFGTSSQILHTFCGGVHILDFLTRSPDLYSAVIPCTWRRWFAEVDVQDVLDLLMREDLSQFSEGDKAEHQWRDHGLPPSNLINYISDVRRHLLDRNFKFAANGPCQEKSSRQIFMGMNPKKIHEVENFARYMNNLASEIDAITGEKITHLADFGAGQNYLGRVLASKPYNRHIIAIESRSHVVDGAKSLDIHTNIAKKPVIRRNKKAYRAAKAVQVLDLKAKGTEGTQFPHKRSEDSEPSNDIVTTTVKSANAQRAVTEQVATAAEDTLHLVKINGIGAALDKLKDGGTIQYIQHRINNGDISSVIKNVMLSSATTSIAEQLRLNSDQLEATHLRSDPVSIPTVEQQQIPSLMVISLHSCGNLVHHGLRTLTLNPAVKAVALIGCCYNLMTERLGPSTHKLHLRPSHPRLDTTARARDPHGFPMSERFAKYKHRSRVFSHGKGNSDAAQHGERAGLGMRETPGLDRADIEEGIRLNITARMMAVQAPQNWTEAESSSFFTRHFFRALLQRIFLDRGVVDAPPSQDTNLGCSPAGSSWGLANGDSNGTVPVVIGNLKKKCYESFTSYVRGAVEKLSAAGGDVARVVEEKVGSMSDDEIREYEVLYSGRKKDLSIVWSLMAFSAGIVEAMIVVDRWLWLKEQPCVKHAWVQPVFDYAISPRNLVIVGTK